MAAEVSAAIRYQEGTRLAFLLPAEDLLRIQEIAGQAGPHVAKALPVFLEDLRGHG